MNRLIVIISVFILSLFPQILSAQSSATQGTIKAINQLGQAEINSIQRGQAAGARLEGLVTQSLGNYTKFLGAAKTAKALYDATEALDKAECAPDFSVSASHMMPTSCRDNQECSSCYESAIESLTTVRRSLSQLTCIYSNTKTFIESAVAFGDNVSGVHGVSGLAWQSERVGIMESYDGLKKAYDDKYVELMESLQSNLQEIGECENQYGYEDWYGRFGFIYYEMMKEKYKRPS